MKKDADFYSWYAFIGALITWFALILQFTIMMLHNSLPVCTAIIKYFSYFTILSNLLVAINFTVLWLHKDNRLHHFFSNPSTLTATTVYIIVVGVVYNIILRGLSQPEGLFKLSDELLHCVIPLLFLLFWWLYVPKKSLKWRQVWGWLLYPLVYLIYTFIHGMVTNYYPYPFVNVTALGYQQVFVNCIAMTLAFVFFSLLFIAINKGRKKREV